MRGVAFILGIGLLAGCASAPQAWQRAQGGQAKNQEQLSLDQTMCRGEMQKAGLTGNPNEDFLRGFKLNDVFIGCMAQHGWVAAP